MGPVHLVSTWGWGGQAETRWKTANVFKYQEKSFGLRTRYLCLFQFFPQQMGNVPPSLTGSRRQWGQCHQWAWVQDHGKSIKHAILCVQMNHRRQFSDKVRSRQSTCLWVQGGTSLTLQASPLEDVCSDLAMYWLPQRPFRTLFTHQNRKKPKNSQMKGFHFRVDKGKFPTPQKCN